MDRSQLIYIENTENDDEMGFFMLGHVDLDQFNAIVNEEIHGLIGEGMVQGIDSEHTYLKKKEYADYPVTHDYVIRKADKNEPGAFAATLYCEYELRDEGFMEEVDGME